MGTRKNLTIGVTVNLEHYENLRLEVSGEVDSPGDAEELAAFLDDILGKFGRADPATTERVDSYRKRVFPVREPAPAVSGESGGEANVVPDDAGGGLSVPEKRPEAVPLVRPAAVTPPAPAQNADAGSTLTCEVCGGTVTPAEQKMSRLFTSKTLCRACLKKL
jgi:hypothetical protein